MSVNAPALAAHPAPPAHCRRSCAPSAPHAACTRLLAAFVRCPDPPFPVLCAGSRVVVCDDPVAVNTSARAAHCAPPALNCRSRAPPAHQLVCAHLPPAAALAPVPLGPVVVRRPVARSPPTFSFSQPPLVCPVFACFGQPQPVLQFDLSLRLCAHHFLCRFPFRMCANL